MLLKFLIQIPIRAAVQTIQLYTLRRLKLYATKLTTSAVIITPEMDNSKLDTMKMAESST